MPFAGIDIGSTMTKAVVVDKGGAVLAAHIGPTGPEHRHLALGVMEETLQKAGVSFDRLNYIVATGYGRINVPFADRQITEITCHSRGIHFLFPSARTVIDIGGQDSKGIKLNARGQVLDFVMNDKCAAGTGRFLEVIAETLGLGLGELGDISLKADGVVQISNMCTVFAEHEVTSRLAEGVPVARIAAGLHRAVAQRVVNMTRKFGIEKDLVVTGGGAHNIGLVAAIEAQAEMDARVPKAPFLTGALGAALTGKDFYGRGIRPSHPRKKEDVTFFS